MNEDTKGTFEEICNRYAHLLDRKFEHEHALRQLEMRIPAVEKILKQKFSSVHNVEDVEIGYHRCPDSPIGRCVYDVEDVCQDFCLYCGHPEERK